MTPPYLIAEGQMPGRPRLAGAVIQTREGSEGEVVHEDPSGIMLRTKGGDEAHYYPFSYRLIKDPPNGNRVPATTG